MLRRSRTALKRVAGWLAVPWTKAALFEILLAHQQAAFALKHKDGAPAAQWDAAARWAKVSAAAIGGGTLFAVLQARASAQDCFRI